MEYPHINILSNNPFTAEGIKYFLVSNIPAEINIITFNNRNSLNFAEVRLPYAEISTVNNKNEAKIFKESIAASILLIDDYYIHTADGLGPRGTNNILLYIEKFLKPLIPSGSDRLKTRFIIYTGDNDIIYLKQLMDSESASILHKTSPKEKLLKAIEVMKYGKNYVDPGIKRLISEYRKYISGHPFQKLTYRQLEIMEFISKGYRSNKIAEKLYVSVSTEEKHRNNIKERLEVKSAEELRELAVKNRNEILFLLEFFNNNGKK